jgi:hypothetical protein
MESTTATTPRKIRPKPPTGGLAVTRQLTRSANERVIMLTDTQLTTRNRVGNYTVSICHKRDDAPRVILTVDVDGRSDAYVFGHEYALRILNFKRADYYLLVERIGK